MIDLAAPIANTGPEAERGFVAVQGQWLLAALFAWFASVQLMLLLFLGLLHPLLWIAGIALAALLTGLAARAGSALPAIPLRRLALLFLFSLALYALGGEGRFFYANIDWQIRDAVLRDMTLNPWPFVYQVEGRALELLRAPIGFFLAPALAAKAGGTRVGELLLLVQNATLLTILLGLGSILLATMRQRVIALVVVTFFSGADILLNWLVRGGSRDHLEFAIPWLQYSSHITQAFWVPQHAMAGWIGALLLLLWHRGRIPLWTLLALLPLTAIWSPLPLFGMIPFAAYAGWKSLVGGTIRATDFVLPALAVVLALPALTYLAAAPDVVGFRFISQAVIPLLLFIAAECLIWSLPLLKWRRGPDFPLLVLATGLLLTLPFGKIGWSVDFVMRASIPALAIIAFAAAEAIASRDMPRAGRIWLAIALAIGSVTGLHEIARAVSEPPSPRGECSIHGAWVVSFGQYPMGSHLAPLDQVPTLIRPADPARISIDDPTPCWRGNWRRPSGL